MKAKINELGHLKVERLGKFNVQNCPFNNFRDFYCGEDCPLFEEIECASGLRVHLRCSNDKHYVFEVIDERTKL